MKNFKNYTDNYKDYKNKFKKISQDKNFSGLIYDCDFYNDYPISKNIVNRIIDDIKFNKTLSQKNN